MRPVANSFGIPPFRICGEMNCEIQQNSVILSSICNSILGLAQRSRVLRGSRFLSWRDDLCVVPRSQRQRTGRSPSLQPRSKNSAPHPSQLEGRPLCRPEITASKDGTEPVPPTPIQKQRPASFSAGGTTSVSSQDHSVKGQDGARPSNPDPKKRPASLSAERFR